MRITKLLCIVSIGLFITASYALAQQKNQVQLVHEYTYSFEKGYYNSFIEVKEVDRRDRSTSLLFRPVGQNILYSVLKISLDNGKKEQAINFFAQQDFSLENEVWKKVFLDEETGSMKTTKTRQKFAFQLILKKLEIRFKQTDKDKELFENFDISIDQL